MLYMGIAAKPSILYLISIYRLIQIKYENHEIINQPVLHIGSVCKSIFQIYLWSPVAASGSKHK